ncbi:NAD(P)H-dependent oxidoreductase [Cytobacillus sp. FJAT-54145]|uniref:NAD(P)H-dependent oxidoreductase n=1 Tax=Cytobacillus spartinae TaxID=3299023 RepID=A0ABW6K714_9BACI
MKFQPLNKETILEAFRSRHATRSFDASRKIQEEDFDFILETGRLSPSSVGFEPWKFLVIQNQELRDQLREVSWGAQGQLQTASHFVIILAKTNLRYDSDYVINHLKTVKDMPDEVVEQASARYKVFQEKDLPMLDSERALFDWASKQTYIALANMMTGAALIGIDSCPIEGFQYAAVNKILADRGLLDDGEWQASVMVAFGYRLEDPKRPKTRKEIAEAVKWIR